MQAALLAILGLSWVQTPVAHLISPSMLHHGPILQQVTTAVGNYSEVYHFYSVTYTTTRSKEFCVMAASASAYGFRLNVLGEARQSNFERDRYLDKLWALKEFMTGVINNTASDMKARTLILFLDAYDVLVTGTPQTLVKRFVKSKRKILFSAETGCAMDRERLALKKNTDCDPNWPFDEHTTTPFLNSGVYVGFVSEVDQLLTAAKTEYESYIQKLQRDYGPLQSITTTTETSKGPWDPYLLGTEQQLISDLFAHQLVHEGQKLRNAIGMSLDYHSRIFVSLYQMEIGREIQISKNGRALYEPHLPRCDFWSDGHSRNKCLQKSKRHGMTRPVVFHVNGPKKDNFLALASKVRWPSHEELWESEIFSVDLSLRLSLKEMCALHTDELACGSNIGHCLAQNTL